MTYQKFKKTLLRSFSEALPKWVELDWGTKEEFIALLETDDSVPEKAFDTLLDLYWEEFWDRQKTEENGVCPNCNTIVTIENSADPETPAYYSKCKC